MGAKRRIAAVTGVERQPDEIEHLQHVGSAELVAEAEAKDVEAVEGPATLHGKQRRARAAQPLSKIRGRQVSAIAQLPRLGIEDRIENDVAEIAGTDLIDLGVGEGPADRRGVPIPWLHPQLIAEVAAGARDSGIDQLSESGHRRGSTVLSMGLRIGQSRHRDPPYGPRQRQLPQAQSRLPVP